MATRTAMTIGDRRSPMPGPSAVPMILFGAFDRHNFGDLLLAHVAAALLDGRLLVLAGLAGRDLQGYGGHPVRALTEVAEEWRDRPVDLVHVGGELLTCGAWEAAVMLQTPDDAAAAIRRFDAHPTERLAWAQETLGYADLAPYTVSRERFPRARRVIYLAVGGVDLGARDEQLRCEVFAKLRVADAVSVRDGATLAQLKAAGVAATLIPDPVVMLAELFGPLIRARAQTGEVARVRATFPAGYIAIQFSADFGDDATLDVIAQQLDRAASEQGLGVVFFRAGAAPWHDDIGVYERVAGRLRPRERAVIFGSLDIWDIGALIAMGRIYVGGSLHGRIAATAFGRPRINLGRPSTANAPTKQAAYAASWEAAGVPVATEPTGIAAAIRRALALPPQRLQDTATLPIIFRRAFFDLLS